MSSEVPSTATLWRRLAAIIYDSFLIFAFVFIILGVLFAVMQRAFTGPLLTALVYCLIFMFYAYFWRVKGQTLGMQVWKIRTVNETGEILTWGECAVRFFFATFSLIFMGLGFVWILFDPERLAWHDRASGTRVLFLGKDPYRAKDPAEDA